MVSLEFGKPDESTDDDYGAQNSRRTSQIVSRVYN